MLNLIKIEERETMIEEEMDATTKVTIVLLLFAAIAIAVVIWAYFQKKNSERTEHSQSKVGPRNGPTTARLSDQLKIEIRTF